MNWLTEHSEEEIENINKLAGKVAVVTGGNSGMGLVTAKEFAKQGAKVVITGRRQKDLDDAVKEIGANVEAIQGDISKMADLDRLAAHMKKVYGKVDVIFANAGLGNFAPLEAVTEEQFDLTFDVNVKGTFFTIQKLLSLVPDGGSIIIIASIAASTGMEGASVYSASKAALRSLARTWTSDLKSRKIRVNTLSPGPIETPILEKSGLSAEQVEGFKASIVSQVPLGRMGTSEEIAKPALFLACDDSSYITGIELTVDGGMSQV